MKILITGANGYLASNLINYFSDKHEIFATTRRNLDLNLRCSLIDSTVDGWLSEVKNNHFDVVINAVACYGRRKETLSNVVASNISFPLSIIENIDKGNTIFINCGTSLPPDVSPYAATKNLFSNFAENLTEYTDLKFINLKLEHFFGPYDSDDKFTSMVIRRCCSNQELALTSGMQKRDFIYISDLLSAFDSVLNNLEKFDNFDSIEIGSGEQISIRDFVHKVSALTDSQSIIRFGAIQSRKNEVLASCADTTRLRELGWVKKFSLDDAITEIISKENL